MIILNWLVLGPFAIAGGSGARDANVTSAFANDPIGETTVEPAPGLVSLGQAWQVLSQKRPDFIDQENGYTGYFQYDEPSGKYYGTWTGPATGYDTFTIVSFTDDNITMYREATKVNYIGKMIDALHIKGTGSPVYAWDLYEYIDMTKYMSPIDRAFYYAAIYVYSPTARSARLLVRSDDDVKVWLNHIKVHEYAGGRGVATTVDKANVSLIAGWNMILVKVINSGGPTGFAVCVADTNDAAMTDLIYSTSVSASTATPTTTTPEGVLAGYDASGKPIYSVTSAPYTTVENFPTYNNSWQPGMTASEYIASLPVSQQQAALDAMYGGSTALPPAPQSSTLMKTTDSLIASGWGVSAQMVFWAALGIIAILIVIFAL
jgi:hypothetical protein